MKMTQWYIFSQLHSSEQTTALERNM